MTNACCVYDWTIKEGGKDLKEKIISFLDKYCKKWVFQKEMGEETGYIHYQGRLSLKVKERFDGVLARFNMEYGNGFGHLSLTSSANQGNMFYVMKEDTRIDGPWTNEKDAPLYVPRQVREIQDKLYPWQKYIVNSGEIWDTRSINVVVNATVEGGIGKSTLKTYVVCKKIGLAVPPLSSYQDICQFICSFPPQRIYVFDLPRNYQSNKNMLGFWNGIEDLKNGYVFDTRYHGKVMTFDCPNIWIFTNEVPDIKALSSDKWVFWSVYNGNLVRFKPQES